MHSNQQRSSLLLQRINPNSTTTNSSCFKQAQQQQHAATLPRRSTLSFCATPVPESIARFHTHPVSPTQCCSAVVQEIAAPVSSVWPVVRRFDTPQAYKHFVKSCHVLVGDGNVGTLREVHVISGLPAANSTERLEILDDERHIISFSVVGGDHRLANYRSVTTLHPASSGNGTVVVESYVVDVPPGNTKDETCVFVDTIVKCNLQSLAQIAETSARRGSS
ncbi:hypothetical protein RJ639_037499 [Escallonia herrerae]|uniref:Abscisic acid receptor PYL4 n=1 Tax=Escallonia herrerae TaxID=1293975 RepID=A0AA88WLN0_9ASTE|nr:hypothetical protein RJ639_037499 [Escallonia herrerae]